MREFEFSYTDHLRRNATHNVQIFHGEGWTTVLATDRSTKHSCPSLTNSIEQLVTELVADGTIVNPGRLVVIEHYDDLSVETWDLVSFERRRDGSFTNPEWRAISKEEAENWCQVGPLAVSGNGML
jgi:hypothetical protein